MMKPRPRLLYAEAKYVGLALSLLLLSTHIARADIEGLALHGFADVQYTSTGEHNPPAGKSGFRLGNFDLYFTPNLTERIRLISEDVVEFDDWHAPGQANGQPVIDIERLQVGYVVSDELTVWLGRFHTPYGYWNIAFHHGAQLQSTVLRPQFVAFEDHGGVLPAHENGLWGTGRHAVGPGHVTYDAYVGNGERILDDQLDMQNAGGTGSPAAIGGRLGYEFAGGSLDTLWIGVHGIVEQVNVFSGDIQNGKTDVGVIGGFLHWTPLDWELIGEYYGFRNKPHATAGPTRDSNAWYVQAGYTFFGRITPLARYERDALSQNDGYFQYLQGGKSYTKELIGLRFDLTPRIALKVDASHTNGLRDGGQTYDEAHLQVAVRF